MAAGAPFNSLPLYTAATTTAASPPSPPPTIPEPTTTSTSSPIINHSLNRNQTPLTTPTVRTCFRLLCHASRIGGVIGKSGSIIKQLQEDTSSKIRVDDAPPESEYRVITIFADSTVNRIMSFDEEDYEENDDYVESNEYTEVSAAQLALVRVYERILTVAAEADGCYFAPGGVVSCRLLINMSLVGFVIGRCGNVVERIKKDTGCKIKVMSHERSPSCALLTDEMIEIEGDIVAVKKALVAVARRIQDCPPPDKLKAAFGRPDSRFNRELVVQNGHMGHFQKAGSENGFNPVLPNRHVDHVPAPTGSGNYASGGWHYGPLGAESSSSPDFRTLQNQQLVAFRMLCSGDLVGGVIGNAGTIIRAFENQTGASINVAYPVPKSEERLITITATESPESQNSPAQNAVILIFSRYVETAYEKGLDSPSSGTPVSAKLVFPRYQTGCLLGKGGSIMADMRKVTGAYIKIVSGNNFPGCASETDEVVLMTGEFVNVRDALYSVTGRLRNHLFTSGRKTYRRGNGQPSFNQHTTLTQSMDNLSLFGNEDHPSSSGHWQPQAKAENLMNGHDVDRGSTSVKGGVELGRGGRSAIITNQTVEVMVPEDDIGCIYGENGSNLTRLRQISGAKVVVHEPDSRKTDYTVVISGTPDQTQSAQSLLQAFILAEQH
ncbi:hypothetical protein QVD17_12938 [Tagetes erecta]|uniref:K Homology domain-containing protein n=1 Tax=Tagetes erecta TaxID=13708 RepID=A0AAD8L035_TARER|nr:hypothetical protein QVD17_12938 [Tagetes erecta]